MANTLFVLNSKLFFPRGFFIEKVFNEVTKAHMNSVKTHKSRDATQAILNQTSGFFKMRCTVRIVTR